MTMLRINHVRHRCLIMVSGSLISTVANRNRLLPSTAIRAARAFFQPVASNPYENDQSLEYSFRARRFARVQSLLDDIMREKEHVEILDMGGTETYWRIGREFIRRHRSRLHITLINPQEQTVSDRDLFSASRESAVDPQLMAERRFDLVHSNSVIEHVGSWSEFELFARNTRRLAPRYFVQTPNFWFPYEPHFRFPGFQYLPKRLRAELLTRFQLGFFDRIGSLEEAREIVHYHRLLSTREMATLFPDGEVVHEKWMGVNKSIMAIRSEPPLT